MLTGVRRPLHLLVLAFAALAACAGTGEGAAPTTTTEPPSTTTTTALVDARPFAVESSELVTEDTSRPTAAAPDRGLVERPGRTLPLLVLAPEGDGPFPVVVFAHGVTASGPAYEPFLTAIAEAGYVVVAPTFPLSSGPDGTIFDYVNQPADMYVALDEVHQALGERVDTERLALAGHSLGAMTTVGAAYHSCCADDDVDAAVVLSGVEAPFPDGDYGDRPPVPMLLAHGDLDSTIVVSSSEDLFARATGPVAFLRFPAGTHTSILTEEAGDVLVAAIVAWLDRWLLDEAGGLDLLPAAVEETGIARLELRGT